MTKTEKMQRLGVSMDDCYEWLYMTAEESMQELDKLKIPYAKRIEWKINTRAQRWGRCRRFADGSYEIQVNVSLFAEDAFNGLKNTIIHELLHTCPDCMCHTGLWKKYADMVNAAYGYGIKRTSSAEEKNTENLNESTRFEIPKFRLECVDCGSGKNFYRNTKAVKNYQYYRCGRCNGKLKKIVL